VRFDWRVCTDRPLLRPTPILAPAFRWNHDWGDRRAIERLAPYARGMLQAAGGRRSAGGSDRLRR
jgi:hypothetical protein